MASEERILMHGIRFPDRTTKLERDLSEYRDASADERHQAALELSDLSERLLLASPRRARQLELLDARERAGRERWKEWIRFHAIGKSELGAPH